MPVKHLLPPSDGYEMQAPVLGEWQRVAGFSSLLNIAKGLKAVDYTDPTEADLISIPDVWAQIQIVDAALCDPGHPLHRRVLGEWRGLIALLALTSQRDLPITISTIDVGALRPHQSGLAAAEASGPYAEFAEVLHSLLPTSNILSEGGWQKLGLICYRSVPIGLLVSSTLVCPIREYAGALDEAISFQSGGRLIDPITAPGLTSTDYFVITRLLQRLRDQLLRQGSGQDARRTGIATRLIDYREACVSRVPVEPSEGNITTVHQDRFESPYPFFEVLATTIRIAGPRRYSALLRPRPEFAHLLQGALIVDPTLAASSGRSVNDIIVWDRYTLQQWTTQPNIQTRVREEAAKAGYMIMSADDLFTQVSCHIDNGTISLHPDGTSKFILPLKSVLLFFLTPDQIAEGIAVQETVNTANFTLSLKVEAENGGGGQDHGRRDDGWGVEADRGRTIFLRREYALTRNDYLTASSGARLVAWPNFARPDWSRHYLFHAGSAVTDVQPAACLTEGAIAEIVGDARAGDCIAILRGLDVTLANAQEALRYPDRDMRATQGLFKLKRPLEAIACEFGPERQRVGLMLFPSLMPVAAAHRRARVGIDFGTTNTIAYVAIGDGLPRRLEIEDRHVTPYAERLSADDLAIFSMDFLPLYKPTVPFMTLLRQRNMIGAGRVREVILTDRIFYFFDVDRPVAELQREAGAQQLGPPDHSIRTNLKWGGGNSTEVQLFLTQLALQILAEVIAAGGDIDDIAWNFSYPEAFSHTHKAAFEGVLQTAVTDALPSGRSAIVKPLLAESLAAAQYFRSGIQNDTPAYFGENVLTMDVGGGTTDMSLWQNNQLLWQSSFMLAGRNLLIDFLHKDISRRDGRPPRDVMLFQAMTAKYKSLGSASNSIISFINAGGMQVVPGLEMFVNHPNFMEAFSRPGVDYMDVPAFSRLTALAELALAGKLWYAALMIKKLGSEAIFNKMEERSTFICLGGRGSLLYKKVIINHQLENIASMFRKKAGLQRAVHIKFSENPKEEVAAGLLVADANINLTQGARGNAAAQVRDQCVAGAALKVGEHPYDETTLMNTLPTEETWRLADTQILREFVKEAATVLNRAINVPDNVFDHVCNAVNDDLARRQAARRAELDNKAPAGRDAEGMQPPFIIGLRILVGELAAQRIEMPMRG